MTHAELFVRFAVVSLLAFGGGQAALPLIEEMVVEETGWLSPAMFGTAVALGYLTPGPVLITATFVGQHVAGLTGALVATVGAFVMPWLLATAAARQVARLAERSAFRAFAAGATPAVIGMLGATALVLSREAAAGWLFMGIAGGALLLTAFTRVHPVALLTGGGIAGWLLS